ncbi:hypothetical protein ABK040_008592 [Willaertia magna]
MTISLTLEVFLTDDFDCFISLPYYLLENEAFIKHQQQSLLVFKCIRNFSEQQMVELQQEELKIDYLCWQWKTHYKGKNKIGIPNCLATKLNLKENEILSLQLLETPLEICKRVFIEAINKDDYEVLDMNSSLMENEFLKQVKIVYKNMKFPLFIDNIEISCIVKNFSENETNEVYKIDNGSEVVACFPKEESNNLENNKQLHFIKVKLKNLNKFNKTIQKCNDQRFIPITKDIAEQLNLQNGDLIQVLNILFLRKNISLDENEKESSNTANNQQQQGGNSANNEMKGSNPLEQMKEFEEKKERRTIYGRVLVLDDKNSSLKNNENDEEELNTIYLSQHLIWELGAIENATVYLKFIEEPIYPIHIHTIYLKQIKQQYLNNEEEAQQQNNTNKLTNLEMEQLLQKWINERCGGNNDYNNNSFFSMKSLPMSQRNVIEMKGYGKFLLGINEIISFNSNEQVNDEDLDDEELEDENCFLFNEFTRKSSIQNLYLLHPNYNLNNEEEHFQQIQQPYYVHYLDDQYIKLEIRKSPVEMVPDLFSGDYFSNSKNGNNKDSTSGNDRLEEEMDYILKRLKVQYGGKKINYLKEIYNYSNHSNCNIIITGSVGIGKTFYAKSLAKHVNVYTVFVPCASLAGDRTDTLTLKLKSYLQEAMIHSPSIIIFDDIESLFPVEQEEVFPDINIRVASSTFIELIKHVQLQSNINIIATCKSLEETNRFIQESKLFEFNLRLLVPNREQRFKIFNFILNEEDEFKNYFIKKETLEEMVNKSENYSPTDIKNLLEKMINLKLQYLIHEKKYEILNQSPIHLTIEDFQQVSSHFIRQTTEGIKLMKSTTSFNEIGGLQNVKHLLKETFILPIKYSKLFENAPIKPRSGCLLYGPPGCGKTFIASAIAHECGMNFITIKGPELLNKYIGASEQAVRDVFIQAESAKPCIIFFDEFDAIAAKRGHDNTGVTDRVVNQFLCQLDGVESRKGIYILAASSRPDLIDPALLRPGRLDKSVLCNLPTREEREDILNVILKNQQGIKLALDVDFGELADCTENYSGADLQALFYSATLEAYRSHHQKLQQEEGNNSTTAMRIQQQDNDDNLFTVLTTSRKASKRAQQSTTVADDTLSQQLKQMIENIQQLEKANEEKKETTMKKEKIIEIQREDFIEALKSSRASLSQDEIDKYNFIYETFSGESSSEEYLQKLLMQQHKRVTLA